MEVESVQEPLLFSGIQVGSDAIALIERDTVTKRVAWDDVESIELRHGFLSRHPIIQILFGAGLIWLGHYPALSLIRWFREGGTTLDIVALALVLIPVGAWLIYDALKRGFYLDLRTTPERLRFPLSDRPSDDDLQEFLRSARSRTGFEIADRT